MRSENAKTSENGVSSKSESKISKSKKLPYKVKRDSSGRSLLQRACKKGNFADVQDYIERVLVPMKRISVDSHACMRQHWKVIHKL